MPLGRTPGRTRKPIAAATRKALAAPSGLQPFALWELLAVMAIIALATWVRLDDLGSAYRHDTASQFVDGEPLLLNPDGYYFLSLARDVVERNYAPVDVLRGAPIGAPRPVPPPPLALLTAAIPNHRTAPRLGRRDPARHYWAPCSPFPYSPWDDDLGGAGAGLAAALIAVLSHYYVYRTTVGFHDTDALNVTLAMALAWWGLALATARPERFLLCLGTGACVFALYLWWWQGAYSVVTLMGIWTLMCAVALRPRSRRETVLVLGTVGIGSVLAPGVRRNRCTTAVRGTSDRHCAAREQGRNR